MSREFFNRCIAKWGVKLQLIVAMEELAELIVAISHHIRLTDSHEIGWGYWDGQHMEELIEEIADVEIMINFIKHNYNLNVEVDQAKKEKIQRTEARLKQ